MCIWTIVRNDWRTIGAARCGYGVRLASRPAELAKALADGRAQLLVHDVRTPVDEITHSGIRALTVNEHTTPDTVLVQLRQVHSAPP